MDVYYEHSEWTWGRFEMTLHALESVNIEVSVLQDMKLMDIIYT